MGNSKMIINSIKKFAPNIAKNAILQLKMEDLKIIIRMFISI